MGIFSFLFGGCGKQPQQQHPQATQQERSSIPLTKPPEVTSESEEGFHDLVFYIQEHKTQPDGTQTIRGAGTHKGRQLGLEVTLGSTWQAGSLGQGTPLVTYRGTVTYRSTGPESDAFLQVLDELYGTKLGPKAMGTETPFTGISLGGDPRDLTKGPVKIKLFFESGGQDDYAELTPTSSWLHTGSKSTRKMRAIVYQSSEHCRHDEKFNVRMGGSRLPYARSSNHLVRFLQFTAIIAGCGCHSPQPAVRSPAELLAARTNYPAHWWTPVPTNGAPAWEILRQAAGPSEVILSKRHELGLLSNFAATPFTFRGQRYASLEGFWQMMKYPESDNDPRAKFPGLEWRYTRDQVAQLTAFDAKRAGDLAEKNMKQMGITWVTFEGRRLEYRANQRGAFYELITAATREKVRQNPEVKKVLLATGDLVLKPDHHQETNAPPAWRYHAILTEIRGELRRKEK